MPTTAGRVVSRPGGKIAAAGEGRRAAGEDRRAARARPDVAAYNKLHLYY